jgi:hypothetical protein
VGLGYFYLWFGRGVLQGWNSRPMPSEFAAADPAALQHLAVVILAMVVLGQWVFMGSRAALQFSEVELAFLLPAPISRRQLIRYKLIRSQLGTLVSAGFLTLLTGRFGSDGRVIFHVLGWWLVLTLLNLHAMGVSFTLQRLTERGLSSWIRRSGAVLVALVLIGTLVAWVRTVPPPPAMAGETASIPARWAAWVEMAVGSGPGTWILLPFRWAVQPWFAQSATQFLVALGPAALLLVALVAWVERGDVAFEEASLALAEKRAAQLARVQTGHPPDSRRTGTAATAPFPLVPTGPPVVALIWKNLIAARITPRKLAVQGSLCAGVALMAQRSPIPEEVLALLWALSLMACLALILVGGSQCSATLRRDLGILDVLRGYPVPGWQLVLGELAGPAIPLLFWQGVSLVVAVILLPEDIAIGHWTAGGLALAAWGIAAPLNGVNALVPAAAALLFPAWSRLGRDVHQPGFEAIGQRILFGFAQVLALAAALAPAVLVGAGAFVVVQWVLGPGTAVLGAAIVASAILTVEAALGIRILGGLFDRYDASLEA